MEWIRENLKEIFLLLTSGGLLGWLSKKYNLLRLKPKEVADVKKTENDIVSSNISDALKINKGMIEQNGTLMAQLTWITAAFEKVRANEESQRLLIIDLEDKIRGLLETIEDYEYCKKELKRLKDKYEPE